MARSSKSEKRTFEELLADLSTNLEKDKKTKTKASKSIFFKRDPKTCRRVYFSKRRSDQVNESKSGVRTTVEENENENQNDYDTHTGFYICVACYEMWYMVYT